MIAISKCNGKFVNFLNCMMKIFYVTTCDDFRGVARDFLKGGSKSPKISATMVGQRRKF